MSISTVSFTKNQSGVKLHENCTDQMYMENEILMFQYLYRRLCDVSQLSDRCSGWRIKASFVFVMTVCSFLFQSESGVKETGQLRFSSFLRGCGLISLTQWTVNMCWSDKDLCHQGVHITSCCCSKTHIRWHFTMLPICLLKGNLTHRNIVIERLWKVPASNI